MFAFLTPNPTVYGFGEASIGITAGRGREGAGEADLRIDIAGEAAPKDDRLLWLIVLGGFIGIRDVGVPGHEGTGEPIAIALLSLDSRVRKSGGAGLLEEIRRPGKSIFKLFPIFAGMLSRSSNVKVPSFVFKV